MKSIMATIAVVGVLVPYSAFAQREAPVGHRQPTIETVARAKSEKGIDPTLESQKKQNEVEKSQKKEREIDKKLNICRGC